MTPVCWTHRHAQHEWIKTQPVWRCVSVCVWSLGGPQLLPGALQSSFILRSQCSRAFTPTDSTTPSLCLSCMPQSTHTHTHTPHCTPLITTNSCLYSPHTHTHLHATCCCFLSHFFKPFGAFRSQTFHVRCLKKMLRLAVKNVGGYLAIDNWLLRCSVFSIMLLCSCWNGILGKSQKSASWTMIFHFNGLNRF